MQSPQQKLLHSLAALATAALLLATPAAHAQIRLPSFEAVSLTGQRVTERQLLGQPAVLIVTPSRGAAQDTRAWAQALQRQLDPGQVRVRDVLAIDLPFFMSERDALGIARERIPARFHDQTWLLGEEGLEKGLDIPVSDKDAHVLVLDAQGQVVVRAQGQVTPRKLRAVEQAVERLTG